MMILGGAKHSNMCYPNTPQKVGCMGHAPALNLTTLFEVVEPFHGHSQKLGLPMKREAWEGLTLSARCSSTPKHPKGKTVKP